MSGNIISYIEMCQREGTSLQRGMNFGLGGTHSVVLMSVRSGAPYQDRLEEDGTVLIYEGHDQPRSKDCPDPKKVDQPHQYSSGSLTQNGLFHRAVEEYRQSERPPERVRVYEKIKQGIWAYNGVFHLTDSWQESDEIRKVYKFRLEAVYGEDDFQQPVNLRAERRRIIPTHVKLEVWQRDGGKCAICGADDELHFNHIVPFSKGGTSLSADNIQLLCVRHNLEKGSKIQ